MIPYGPMSDATSRNPTKAELEAEFEGWECWEGMDKLWHARVKGATPPIMVWGENTVDLRDQIKRRIARFGDNWRVKTGDLK